MFKLKILVCMLWEANFSSFMAIRGIMNKMAEGDEYLECSLECEMKLWFLGALLTAIEMAAFKLTVQTAVCSYHVCKDIWKPTICLSSKAGNDHDRDAVVVVEHFLL